MSDFQRIRADVCSFFLRGTDAWSKLSGFMVDLVVLSAVLLYYDGDEEEVDDDAVGIKFK